MEHIYHKGKYRSGERGRHLRPYLKRKGNKAWRKDAALHIAQELEQTELGVAPWRKERKAPVIRVKITMCERNRIYSHYRSYHSVKAFDNAIRRNTVVRAFIYERNILIEKNENNYT